MSKTKTHLIAISMSGFFLCLDQILKYIAHNNQTATAYIIKPWLGWEYLANTGIAFGLPIPNIFLIATTPVILLILFILFARKKQKNITYIIAVTLIMGGAVSNFIDRVLFEITIDYFRVATSVFNIADIMIVFGAGILLLKEMQIKQKK
jgi:signal peptidase II